MESRIARAVVRSDDGNTEEGATEGNDVGYTVVTALGTCVGCTIRNEVAVVDGVMERVVGGAGIGSPQIAS